MQESAKEGQRQEVGDAVRDRRNPVLEDTQLGRTSLPVLLAWTVVWTEIEWETSSGCRSSPRADTTLKLHPFLHMFHRLLDRFLFHNTRFGQRGESDPVVRAQMNHKQKKILLAHLSRSHSLLIDHSDPVLQIAVESKREAEARPVAVLQETPRESAITRASNQWLADDEKRREDELVGVAKEKERRMVIVRPNCDGKGRRGGNHRGKAVQLGSILGTGGEERGRGGK